MDFDIARADTPGAEAILHFNNAGCALPPTPVLEAVIGHLRREARLGGYEAAERARDAIEGTYDGVARLLNCGRDEVALVENATRAWDMAFYALPLGPGRPGSSFFCVHIFEMKFLVTLTGRRVPGGAGDRTRRGRTWIA
ncbi:MAG TPA: hypothetical protein VFQ87_01430 [Bradyrhizobium sp.]|nr:hypothetical protein [Bradyrhizobium sp.]